MTKNEAIQIFGTAASLARAVGLTRGRISQWPEELEQKQADLVLGAAVRLGKWPLQDSVAVEKQVSAERREHRRCDGDRRQVERRDHERRKDAS